MFLISSFGLNKLFTTLLVFLFNMFFSTGVELFQPTYSYGPVLEKTIGMNMNYNYLTTIFRGILTRIYVFLVLFTIFHFDLEKFISKIL